MKDNSKRSKLMLLYVVLILLAACAAIIMYGRSKNENGIAEEIKSDKKVENRSDADKSKEDMVLQKGRDDDSAAVMKRPRDIDKESWEKIKKYIAYKASNIADINFYGYVLDQNGNSVEKAKVLASVSTYGKKTEIEVQSDIMGRFRIEGIQGTSLHIESIHKDGYVAELKGKNYFIYGKNYGGRHQPSIDNPVVFNVWKKMGSQKLIKGKIVFNINQNEIVSVDIQKQKVYKGKNENADLEVQYRMGEISKNKYDWSLGINVLDGGVILVDDRYLFSAPDNGYEEAVQINFPRENQRWKPNDIQKMYMKIKDGTKYLAVEWKTYTYHDGRASIKLTYLLNPTGSKNLEYGPKELPGHSISLMSTKKINK